MPTVAAVSRRLLEAAEHIRTLAEVVAREAYDETPAVRQLRRASRDLLVALETIDQLRLNAVHILERVDLSEWRLRETPRVPDLAEVSLFALLRRVRAVRRAAVLVMRDDDRITDARRRLLRAVDELERALAELDAGRWADVISVASDAVQRWMAWESAAAVPGGVA